MFDLGFDEQAALELVAGRGEHTVVDRSTLLGLRDNGLVEMADDGWSLTRLGDLASETSEALS